MNQKSDNTLVVKTPSKPAYPIVGCSDCKTSRPMIIKALSPGLFGHGHISYQCTKCGAEKEFSLD
jgi:hypothetical protein